MKLRPRVLAILLVLVGACVDTSDEAAWIERADTARRGADAALLLAEHEASRATAIAEATEQVEAALNDPPPPDLAREHLEAVQQDLAFELANLELAAHDAASALAACDRGLSINRRPTIFTGKLLVARGRAQEALNQPQAAASDYYDALRINEELMAHALGGQR